MTKGNVIRVMDEKDLFDVPDARKDFEKYGHHGNYFFFVVVADNKEVIGYLIAKNEDNRVLIQTLNLPDTLEEKESYRSTALSNLSAYVRNIKNCEGARKFLHVSFA